MRSITKCGWDLAKGLKRLAVNAKVATVLGSIPASFDTVESEGRQMKQCWITSIKRKNQKKSNTTCSYPTISLLLEPSDQADLHGEKDWAAGWVKLLQLLGHLRVLHHAVFLTEKRTFKGVKRGGLKVVAFDRSDFKAKLYTLRFSNKSVHAPSCEMPKTTQRNLFRSFAINNCFQITV